MDPELTEPPTLKSHIIEFIQTMAVFIAIGTVVYFFIAQPHKVSGSSMFPTYISGDYIITNKIGYRISDPKRGEVIVLKNPRDNTQDFIKRIIGLPGENVKVENGHVYINNKLLNENYLKSTVVTTPGAFLQEGSSLIIPDGNYIVMGDNRGASSDSREWGFVKREEIIGQVFLRYWPKESIGLIHGATYSNN